MILVTGIIMKSIEEEIRDIIKEKGISLYRIAKDLGISWESLYRSLLDGANPKWNRIKSLLDYLDYEFVLRPKRKEVKPEKSKPPQSRRKERDSHGSIQKKK
jgi:transcriptional regulator with XRE-family HTH domain